MPPAFFRILALLATLASAVLSVSAQDPAAQQLAAAAKNVREIVAHRGSSADRPENTIAAYEQAIENGATAIEADVRITLDGHLVSIHDDTLSRTTNGDGRVEHRTLAQLKALDAGSWFGKDWSGERIPTLREICEITNGRVDLFLDLKDGKDEYRNAVVQVVRRFGDPRRTILGVRSLEAARFYRQYLPESRQVGLIPTPNDIELFTGESIKIIRLWPEWLQLEKDPTIGDKLVKRVREAGAEILISAGKGTPEEARAVLRTNPEMLFTDDPAALTKTLEQLQR